MTTGAHDPASTTASGYFGAMAESYDSLIRRAVPRYREMTERLIDYLPADPSPGRAARVLELGCGTGNLTLALAARYPGARITAVDAAPEMIGITRARLDQAHRGTAHRAEFVTARFEELSFPAGSFDLVASCISLHHVADKGSLYRSIHAWLSPRASFRFADQLRGATPEVHELNWARWLGFCRGEGGCNEEEIKSLLDHAAAHDHYTALPEHFRLLREAGFDAAALDCVWRNWIWGIVLAAR